MILYVLFILFIVGLRIKNDINIYRHQLMLHKSPNSNLIVPPFMLPPKFCVQLRYLKERNRSPVYRHNLSYLPNRYRRKSTTNYATSFWKDLLNLSMKRLSKNVQRHLLWVSRCLPGEYVDQIITIQTGYLFMIRRLLPDD